MDAHATPNAYRSMPRVSSPRDDDEGADSAASAAATSERFTTSGAFSS